MSAASGGGTPGFRAPDPLEAVLRELALMRLLLESIRQDVEAIRQEVEAAAAAPPPYGNPLPAVGAPLAAGGGASYPGFRGPVADTRPIPSKPLKDVRRP